MRKKYLLIIFLYSCHSTRDPIPSEIIDINRNLVAALSISATSPQNVVAILTYKNLSVSDTFLLYKPLLPKGNNVNEDLFGGFAVDNYSPISYKGKAPRSPYLTEPILQTKNFIALLPKTQIEYKINLAENYDFASLYKKGERKFALGTGIFMPAVNSNLEQIYKIDTLDHVSKPLYYEITFPENKNIDSMRVYFTIP